MKPSERIKSIVGEKILLPSLQSIDARATQFDFVNAIMDYLDEEYEGNLSKKRNQEYQKTLKESGAYSFPINQ